MRIYISGPLQGSSDLPTARHLYETIAEALLARGHEPYVPHLHTDPEHAPRVSALDVFRTDLARLLSADVIIAHIGAPSTGVGAEVAIAIQHEKRVIGIQRSRERSSRFALGLVLDAGGDVVKFADEAQLAEQLGQLLGPVSSGRPTADTVSISDSEWT